MGAYHYQWQLASRLPDLLLLDDLLRICWPILGTLMIPGFVLRVLEVVDFISVVVSAAINCVMFVLALSNGPVGHDIESSLSLCD